MKLYLVAGFILVPAALTASQCGLCLQSRSITKKVHWGSKQQVNWYIIHILTLIRSCVEHEKLQNSNISVHALHPMPHQRDICSRRSNTHTPYTHAHTDTHRQTATHTHTIHACTNRHTHRTCTYTHRYTLIHAQERAHLHTTCK